MRVKGRIGCPDKERTATYSLYRTMYPMTDQFTEYYTDLLDGTYDCVDRIVINAYNPLLHSGGGFRTWWRMLHGNDDHLDDTHLMRFAGHFSRRVKTFAAKNNIPLVFCDRDDRKDELIKEHLPRSADYTGLFCIFVNRANASVLQAHRFGNCGIDIRKKNTFINHYAFHIMDKQWGHVIIRFCPHPPFSAMIILNGHEYVERTARKRGIVFTKEDNCFTDIPNAPALNRIADSMISNNRDVGRLLDVCERWIYSCCLCFALDIDEQQRTDFRYSYSVYQLEFSRNLLFTRGAAVDTVFNGMIDKTRASLDIRTLKTIFGYRNRPYKRTSRGKPPRFEVTVEKPVYDLTVFKVHFDCLTLKVYSKGERVLRFEAIVHNAKRLKCGRKIDRFAQIAKMLRDILYRFMSALHCVDVSFIDAHSLQSWHLPTVNKTGRVAGIDINNPRIRAFMESLIALSIDPFSITTPKLAQAVSRRTGQSGYLPRHAAYDLKKFRAKKIVAKGTVERTYTVTPDGLRAMTAFLTIRDKVLIPIITSACKPKRGPKPVEGSDVHYRNIQNELCQLFEILKIAA